jgi:putative polyketide hydroxylase
VAAVLHGQAGPAHYSIYTYHTMNGTNRTALTIYAAAGLCLARLRHGSRRRRGAPLIDYGGGDDGLIPRYRSSAILGASEDISPLLPKEHSGRAWYTRTPHVAVTFGGWEISTIDLYGRRFVLLACGGQWRGVDLGCGVRNAAACLGVPLDLYIASVWSWEVLKWRRPRITST